VARVLVVNAGSSSLKLSLIGAGDEPLAERSIAADEVGRLPALLALTELAPLHQPKSLAALDEVSAALPNVPAVGCFDTAFHATMPAAAATYALPASWGERWGIRRYGFHGLSHAWVARRVPELLGRDGSELRIISCHLGGAAGAPVDIVAVRAREDLEIARQVRELLPLL
jgi:acetate kinase